MSRTGNGREEGRAEERIDYVNLADHLWPFRKSYCQFEKDEDLGAVIIGLWRGAGQSPKGIRSRVGG